MLYAHNTPDSCTQKKRPLQLLNLLWVSVRSFAFYSRELGELPIMEDLAHTNSVLSRAPTFLVRLKEQWSAASCQTPSQFVNALLEVFVGQTPSVLVNVCFIFTVVEFSNPSSRKAALIAAIHDVEAASVQYMAHARTIPSRRSRFNRMSLRAGGCTSQQALGAHQPRWTIGCVGQRFHGCREVRDKNWPRSTTTKVRNKITIMRM